MGVRDMRLGLVYLVLSFPQPISLPRRDYRGRRVLH
jgi:hypothetical protein